LRGPRGGIILMGKDFDNPFGETLKSGKLKKMSTLLNFAEFVHSYVLQRDFIWFVAYFKHLI
jgi:hypothetical protein